MPDFDFNGDNGDTNGDFGDAEEFREFVNDRGNDIQEIAFIQMDDGEGYANVKYDDQWFGFDLEGFDAELWQNLFDWLMEYDIDYEVYSEA